MMLTDEEKMEDTYKGQLMIAFQDAIDKMQSIRATMPGDYFWKKLVHACEYLEAEVENEAHLYFADDEHHLFMDKTDQVIDYRELLKKYMRFCVAETEGV